MLAICATSAAAQTPPAAPAAGIRTGRLVGLPFNASFDTIDYHAIITVENGKLRWDRARRSGVKGGKVTARGASGVAITTRKDQASAILVGNGSDFTLSDATIDARGDAAGWDENFGVGAAVVAGKGGTLTLRNVRITTHGIKSTPATSAGVLRVYDSTLVAEGGDVAAENMVPGSGPGYIGPPEALEISGTARAGNVVGGGRAYYYRSTIVSHGWGALSTDSAQPRVYLEINDCTVRALNSGYGTYADIGAEVVANGSRFSSASDTGIISGNGKITLNDVTEDTAVHAVMIHAPGREFTRVAGLTITGGRYATREASVLIKSHNADILFDHAELRPANGVLLQSVLNESKRSALLQWLLAPQKPAAVETGPVSGVRATFRNMDAHGDIVHADTTRPMLLTLDKTRLTGAIKGSVWAIGDVTLVVAPGSHWSATADSRLTLRGSTDAAAFDAPAGVTITAIAGEGTTLRGRYTLASGGTLVVKG